jgi:hypothetical protein
MTMKERLGASLYLHMRTILYPNVGQNVGPYMQEHE